MTNLASILLELLCYLTVEPEDGLDIDKTADLQIDSWQAILHDISDSERQLLKQAAQYKLQQFSQRPALTDDELQLCEILAAFIDDQLQ